MKSSTLIQKVRKVLLLLIVLLVVAAVVCLMLVSIHHRIIISVGLLLLALNLFFMYKLFGINLRESGRETFESRTRRHLKDR